MIHNYQAESNNAHLVLLAAGILIGFVLIVFVFFTY